MQSQAQTFGRYVARGDAQPDGPVGHDSPGFYIKEIHIRPEAIEADGHRTIELPAQLKKALCREGATDGHLDLAQDAVGPVLLHRVPCMCVFVIDQWRGAVV
jgi:hypothetical protein